MLAPVAVTTQHQGKGVGQALINYGLQELKNRSVAVVITYGDPSFYSKVEFQALSEAVIQAPLKLSMPEGWLGQSLTEEPIPTINERPTCVMCGLWAGGRPACPSQRPAVGVAHGGRNYRMFSNVVWFPWAVLVVSRPVLTLPSSISSRPGHTRCPSVLGAPPQDGGHVSRIRLR